MNKILALATIAMVSFASLQTRAASAVIPVGPPPSQCEADLSRSLGPLACLSCGLKNSNPDKYDPLVKEKSASRWITLLGIMAQTYYGPFNLSDASARKSFQQTVSNMVTQFGYCTDDQYPTADLEANADFVRSLLTGEARLGRDAKITGINELKFASIFGLFSQRVARETGKSESANTPMIYAHAFFANQSGTPEQRQFRFRSMMVKHRGISPDTSFSQCGEALVNKMDTPEGTGFCPRVTTANCIKWPEGARPPNSTFCQNGALNSVAKVATEAAVNRANLVATSMSEACHIPEPMFPAAESVKCSNTCLVSSVYPFGGRVLEGCVRDTSQDPPETPHDPPTLRPEQEETETIREDGLPK